MSRINRPPISLSAISKYMAKVADDKRIVVTVGTVVDDKRLYKVPKLTVYDHHPDHRLLSDDIICYFFRFVP